MFRAPSVNSSVPLRLQQCDTAAGCVGGCICSRVDSEKNTADILQLLNVCSCHLFIYFPSTYITLPTGSTFAELNVDFSGAQAVIALWWSAQVITQIDFNTLTGQTQQPGTSIHFKSQAGCTFNQMVLVEDVLRSFTLANKSIHQ